MNTESTEVCMSSEDTLNDIIIIDTCHYTFVQTHQTCNTTHFIQVNPKINRGPWWLWYVMQFILGLKKKKGTTLDKSCACEGRGISVPPCQFCCKLKTALKQTRPPKIKKVNTQDRCFWR